MYINVSRAWTGNSGTSYIADAQNMIWNFDGI